MKKKIDFAIGGQAVIEGVMMRSPNYIAIAVRKRDNSIKIKNNPFNSVLNKLHIQKIPVLRGIVSFVEMMIIGIKALNYSAAENIEGEDFKEGEEPETKAKPAEKKESVLQKIFVSAMMVVSIVMALGLGLGLFKFLPLYLTELISGKSAFIQDNYWSYNLIDGVIKIAIFVAYIYLISFIPDLKRVFQYHGAEHKAVRTYEADLELNAQNAKKQSRFHPRCGTSFVLIVFLISIVFYTFMPSSKEFFPKLLQRIAVLPFIAGISYEFLKWSAKHEAAWWLKAVITPGLWLQKLTTREPDEKQLDVALSAIKATLDGEEEAAVV